MKSYKIPYEITITEEDLDYIVDSAINYCSYWCDSLDYGKKPKDNKYMSEALSHGGTLIFGTDEQSEEGGETEFELTTEKLLKGLAETKNFDLDNYDGPMADCVLQQALFGEVIYG